MLIPFERGDVVSYLNENANVKNTEYDEKGTRITVELKETDYKRFKNYVIKH